MNIYKISGLAAAMILSLNCVPSARGQVEDTPKIDPIERVPLDEIRAPAPDNFSGDRDPASEFSGDRDPAAARKKRAQTHARQLPKKKLRVEKDQADEDVSPSAEPGARANVNQRSGGADSQEGWIIRRTKDGIIKIPKKETFKFEGGEVSGSAQRPSQTVLGSRPQANRYSLLPERKNYRSDILGSAGAGAVVGTPTSGMK